MTYNELLKIFIAGLIFTFLIEILWKRLVSKYKAFGGILAASLIPGTMWIIAHGVNNSFIVQKSFLWIDMAWAPAVGGIVYSFLINKKLKGIFSNIVAALLGGAIAGVIMIFINKN